MSLNLKASQKKEIVLAYCFHILHSVSGTEFDEIPDMTEDEKVEMYELIKKERDKFEKRIKNKSLILNGNMTEVVSIVSKV